MRITLQHGPPFFLLPPGRALSLCLTHHLLSIERKHAFFLASSLRVCELLLGGPPLWKKERESLTRMRGEVASRSSHPRRAAAVNEGDGQITQCCHNMRSRAGAQAGTVTAFGEIAHIMQTILDAPMTARQIEETARAGLDRREVSDEVDHLVGGLARFAHGDRARQARHLTDQRPRGSQIAVHATTDLDRAQFGTPAMPIESEVLLKGGNDGARIVEIGGQICVQVGLIAFDGQYTGTGVSMSHLHEGGVGMQGVGCVDTRTPW